MKVSYIVSQKFKKKGFLKTKLRSRNEKCQKSEVFSR